MFLPLLVYGDFSRCSRAARKQTAFKKRPMKTPEFVESDSGEFVVQEVIDSSESRLNY